MNDVTPFETMLAQIDGATIRQPELAAMAVIMKTYIEQDAGVRMMQVKALLGLVDAPRVLTPALPMPFWSDMAGVQATIFDNWKEGKKGKGNMQYGLCLEAWTDSKIGLRKIDFKSNMKLHNRASLKSVIREFRSQTRSARKYPVESAHIDTLAEVADVMSKDENWVGLVNVVTRDGDPLHIAGTFYPAGQFVMIEGDVEKNDIVITLMMRNQNGGFEAHVLNTCSDSNPHGGELKANAILQSRTDITGTTEDWAS